MLTQDLIEQILLEVQRKHQVNLTKIDGKPENRIYEQYVDSKTYLDDLISEVEEVKYENKLHNSIYLEDELWDILWDYLNIVYFFEREWKIDAKKIASRCLKKYSERTDWLEKWILRGEVKKWQKAELAREHKEKYGS